MCLHLQLQSAFYYDTSLIKKKNRRVCVSAWCVSGTMLLPDACGNQKRASDPLALELEMVVRHHVVAANELRFSARAASALNL